MKNLIALATATLVLTGPLSATATIQLGAGELKDASSTILSTNTLWALVEADDLGNLPGGLGLNESLTIADGASAWAAFAGQTIAVDTIIDGSRIFAVGDTNLGQVFTNVDILVSPPDAGGVITGRDFALYWFPGLTTGSNVVSGGPFQVGGVHETIDTFGGLGSTVPGDGATHATNFVSSDLFGGPLDPARTTAINAIPEASTSLLALIGLALLRRRR